MFRYIHVELKSSLKYLGFFLKPNDYTKQDWVWMIYKVEGGCLISVTDGYPRGGVFLFKFVFESILVYRVYFAFIPKCVFEKIRKPICRFLWVWGNENKYFPWAS
jgi:hypothetical protein